jgi:hypothetical protein
MLRTLGLIGALVLLTAADAPPALRKAFSGTIIMTYPDGRMAKMWMNPDGTYTSEGRRHGHYRGHWSVNGDQVCFRRSLGHYCTAIPTEAEFTTKAINGDTVRVRLVPGRQSAG